MPVNSPRDGQQDDQQQPAAAAVSVPADVGLTGSAPGAVAPAVNADLDMLLGLDISSTPAPSGDVVSSAPLNLDDLLLGSSPVVAPVLQPAAVATVSAVPVPVALESEQVVSPEAVQLQVSGDNAAARSADAGVSDVAAMPAGPAGNIADGADDQVEREAEANHAEPAENRMSGNGEGDVVAEPVASPAESQPQAEVGAYISEQLEMLTRTVEVYRQKYQDMCAQVTALKKSKVGGGERREKWETLQRSIRDFARTILGFLTEDFLKLMLRKYVDTKLAGDDTCSSSVMSVMEQVRDPFASRDILMVSRAEGTVLEAGVVEREAPPFSEQLVDLFDVMNRLEAMLSDGFLQSTFPETHGQCVAIVKQMKVDAKQLCESYATRACKTRDLLHSSQNLALPAPALVSELYRATNMEGITVKEIRELQQKKHKHSVREVFALLGAQLEQACAGLRNIEEGMDMMSDEMRLFPGLWVARTLQLPFWQRVAKALTCGLYSPRRQAVATEDGLAAQVQSFSDALGSLVESYNNAAEGRRELEVTDARLARLDEVSSGFYGLSLPRVLRVAEDQDEAVTLANCRAKLCQLLFVERFMSVEGGGIKYVNAYLNSLRAQEAPKAGVAPPEQSYEVLSGGLPTEDLKNILPDQSRPESLRLEYILSSFSKIRGLVRNIRNLLRMIDNTLAQVQEISNGLPADDPAQTTLNNGAQSLFMYGVKLRIRAGALGILQPEAARECFESTVVLRCEAVVRALEAAEMSRGVVEAETCYGKVVERHDGRGVGLNRVSFDQAFGALPAETQQELHALSSDSKSIITLANLIRDAQRLAATCERMQIGEYASLSFDTIASHYDDLMSTAEGSSRCFSACLNAVRPLVDEMLVVFREGYRDRNELTSIRYRINSTSLQVTGLREAMIEFVGDLTGWLGEEVTAQMRQEADDLCVALTQQAAMLQRLDNAFHNHAARLPSSMFGDAVPRNGAASTITVGSINYNNYVIESFCELIEGGGQELRRERGPQVAEVEVGRHSRFVRPGFGGAEIREAAVVMDAARPAGAVEVGEGAEERNDEPRAGELPVAREQEPLVEARDGQDAPPQPVVGDGRVADVSVPEQSPGVRREPEDDHNEQEGSLYGLSRLG